MVWEDVTLVVAEVVAEVVPEDVSVDVAVLVREVVAVDVAVLVAVVVGVVRRQSEKVPSRYESITALRFVSTRSQLLTVINPPASQIKFGDGMLSTPV